MLKKNPQRHFFQTALCKLLPGYTDCSLVQQSLETSDSPGQIQNIDKTSVIRLFINKDFGVPIMHQTQKKKKITTHNLLIGSHSLNLERWMYGLDFSEV